jgi:hypothetical protein
MKLYEISAEYIQALDALADADEQTRADTLEGLGIADSFKDKAINIAGYFQSIDYDVASMKDAENRIATRRKAMENHSQSLKDYLLSNMQRTGITRIECPGFSVSLAKCPASVEITDESLLPDNFFRVKKEPNKSDIKAFLQEHGALDGARLVTDKMRLDTK